MIKYMTFKRVTDLIKWQTENLHIDKVINITYDYDYTNWYLFYKD